MNSRELQMLDQIEAGLANEDADFVEMIANGPRLPVLYKAILGMVGLAGLGLIMMFPMHPGLGLAGYLVLVAAATDAIRRRPLKPAHVSPLQVFHRLTAGLLRDPGPVVESALD